MTGFARVAGPAALLCFLAASAIFGAMPDAVATGFSHLTHPLAWLGARGMPHAAIFNFTGFVLPGLLVAVALWSLRPALPTPARWSARLGAQLVVLSALGFAAQGLLPLDLDDPDGRAASLHATAWIAWWLAFCAGALGLALGLRGEPTHRRLAAISAAAAVAVPLIVFVAPLWLPVALAQRVAFALWFVWAIAATRRRPLSRA